jgi:hypothetical protein
MNDSTDTDQGTTLDAAGAAAIMADAQARARQWVRPDHRGVFAVAGLLWLIGYGLVYFGGRSQHPYHGPITTTFVTTFLLIAITAAGTTATVQHDSGVGGVSTLQRRIFLLAVVGGFGAMFAVLGALMHAGASRPVINVYEACAPMLLTGVLYLTRSAGSRDWPMLCMGAWLIAVAAGAGYAGEQAAWLVGALAVGPAYLLVSALQVRLNGPRTVAKSS